MSLLSIRDLCASLGVRNVLQGVSFEVGSGEFVGLIGPNGAGKTTLLRAILAQVEAQGTVEIGGRAGLPAAEQARFVSYLPQEREIAWPVTVERLVMLGRSPYLPAFGSPSAADQSAVEAAMRRMEIEGFARRIATELSGGEKARVLIARALAQETPLLLADEPTSGLDPSHQIALMRVFSDLAREQCSVVACLHDLALAARWCTRLVLLDKGHVVADGPPREVLTAQRLREIYNVTTFLGEDEGGPIILPLDLAD